MNQTERGRGFVYEYIEKLIKRSLGFGINPFEEKNQIKISIFGSQNNGKTIFSHKLGLALESSDMDLVIQGLFFDGDHD